MYDLGAEQHIKVDKGEKLYEKGTQKSKKKKKLGTTNSLFKKSKSLHPATIKKEQKKNQTTSVAFKHAGF